MSQYRRWKHSRSSAFRGGRRGVAARCRLRPHLEGLEDRELLAVVSVNAGQVVRTVDTQLLGVNLAWWDSDLNTAQTQQMVQAAGLTMFRFPGGSSSDDFHFNAPPTYNGEGTDASMASFIASVGGVGLVTLDYGSGSPQEAAAFLAYLECPGRQYDADRQRPGVERLDQRLADGQLADRRLLGQPARRGPAGARRRAQLPPARSSRPVQVPVLGGRQRGIRELGDRPPHAPSTTRRPTSRSPSSSPTYAAQIDPAISIGLDVGSPGDLQQLDGQHPPAVGRPRVHAGVPQRPQLRAGAGERERLEPVARHGHGSQQRSRPTPAIPTTGPCGRPTTRACSRSTWARPARTSSCSRPSSTRSTPTPASRRPAWSMASSLADSLGALLETPTTPPTSGTCGRL